MNKDYIVFSRSFMFIEEGDAKVEVPVYISKSFKRYRYYTEEKIIRKQCVDCKTWYDVLKLEDDEFIDIHDNREIHLRKGVSGFDTRCQKCKEKKVEKKIEEEKEQEKNRRYSLYLKPSNKKYLETAAKLQDKNITDLLNEIIEKENERNSIEKLVKNLYEKHIG